MYTDLSGINSHNWFPVERNNSSFVVSLGLACKTPAVSSEDFVKTGQLRTAMVLQETEQKFFETNLK